MRPAAAVLLVVAATLVAAPAQAKGPEQARDLGLDYLALRVPAASGSGAAGIVEAAAANGLDTASWPSAQDSARSHVAVPAGGAFIGLLRPVRALAVSGVDVRGGPHGDLVARVLDGFDGTQFGAASALNDDAYAILALRAAGVPQGNDTLAGAAAFLRANRNGDGGWGWAVGAPSGTDMTGIVLEALRQATGATTTDAAPALAFLATTHDESGGHAETPGGTPNCESTVWAIRAHAATRGRAPGSAWSFLMSLQAPDGGFRHVEGQSADVLCTTEAVALLGDAVGKRIPFTLRPAPGLGVLAAPVIALGLAATRVLRRP